MSIIELVKEPMRTAKTQEPPPEEEPKAKAKKPKASSKKATAAEPTKGAKAE